MHILDMCGMTCGGMSFLMKTGIDIKSQQHGSQLQDRDDLTADMHCDACDDATAEVKM